MLFLRLIELLRRLRIVEYGLWRYIAVTDDRTCSACMMHHGKVFVTQDENKPDELFNLFPYGQLVSPTLFKPNVHPNCRCVIVRQYAGEKDE